MLTPQPVLDAVLDHTRLDSERRNLPELLRFSPHYYTFEDEIDGAVAHLGALLAEG